MYFNCTKTRGRVKDKEATIMISYLGHPDLLLGWALIRNCKCDFDVALGSISLTRPLLNIRVQRFNAGTVMPIWSCSFNAGTAIAF